MPRVFLNFLCLAISAPGMVFGLVSCASYQPAPLILVSPLKTSLAGLNHNLPGPGIIPTAGPLTAQNIAGLAVLNNPDLVAARTQHGIAQAEVFNAGLLPDPVFSGGFQALTGGPGSIPSIAGSLTQDFSVLITYRVNQRGARAGAAQVDAGILWQEWQTSAQAISLCIAIAGDSQILSTLQQDQEALAKLNASTAAAVAAGNLTIAASSASLAALASTQSALDTQIQKQAQDRDQLDALLGLQPGIQIAVAPVAVTPLAPPAVNAAIASLVTRRPDLIALRYGYAQADAKLRGAILSQFLPISVSADGGRDTSDVQSVGPSITLTLPLFNRNRGNIAIAEATRSALSAQFAASLANAAGSAQALEAQIQILQGQSAAADHNAAASAQISASAETATANGAIDDLTAATLLTTTADRAREAAVLRTQLLTARLSLITLLGIGLPSQALTNLDKDAS